MNSYATKKLRSSKLSSNKTAGVIIWLISAYTTALFIGQIGIKEPISYGLGLAVQWLFTKAETPIWRGRGYPALGIVVTAVDVLFNAVGVWPYVRDQFGATDLWKMLTDITNDPSPPSLFVRFLIVLVVGIAVAAGPEYFWSRED
jgi:hypothetical protein